MKYLVAICFVLIPFGFWGQNIFLGQANTLILSVTLILFLCEQENNYKLSGWIKVMGIYLSLWMALIFLMVFLGRFPQILSMTMIESVFFIFAGLIFFLAVYRGSLSLNTWSNVICVVATIQATLGIMQKLGFDPVYLFLSNFVELLSQLGFGVPVGTLGNPNFLAAFLAISLPFFFRDKWKWLIPIILIALVLTKTTTAIGAAIIGTMYFLFGWKWALGSIVPAFILYAVKYFHKTPTESIIINARIEYWLDAWKSTSHSWQTLLFGWGPGIIWQPGNMLHSEYVNTFFNYGLIGLIIMFGYIASVHRLNKIFYAAFIIICIDMIGNHVLHTTPTAVLIILIIALLERQKQEDIIYAR